MFGIPKTWKVFYFLFLFLFFFLLDVMTWNVKCYSLPFFLLAICNGKYLHRIEHTKWIKQGQDCQKVIANKSLRIYIYIYIYFIYHHYFFSLWSARFLQSWKRVVQNYRIMKTFHHVFCNNCLESRRPGKCFFFFFVRNKYLES